MFPHMMTKAILTSAEKKTDRDNVILINAVDLQPLLAIGTVSVSDTAGIECVHNVYTCLIHTVIQLMFNSYSL